MRKTSPLHVPLLALLVGRAEIDLAALERGVTYQATTTTAATT